MAFSGPILGSTMTPVSRGSLRASAREHCWECPQQDPYVERERPLVDVLKVERHPVVEVKSLRPLICQSPVIPWGTLKRRMSQASPKWATSRVGSGRGPTSDMSP